MLSRCYVDETQVTACVRRITESTGVINLKKIVRGCDMSTIPLEDYTKIIELYSKMYDILGLDKQPIINSVKTFFGKNILQESDTALMKDLYDVRMCRSKILDLDDMDINRLVSRTKEISSIIKDNMAFIDKGIAYYTVCNLINNIKLHIHILSKAEYDYYEDSLDMFRHELGYFKRLLEKSISETSELYVQHITPTYRIPFRITHQCAIENNIKLN